MNRRQRELLSQVPTYILIKELSTRNMITTHYIDDEEAVIPVKGPTIVTQYKYENREEIENG